MNSKQGGFATTRALLVVALIGASLGALLLEIAHQRDLKRLRERAVVLEADVRTAAAKADAALAAIIPPETIAGAARSVYLIVVNGQPRGTAFVIDRENGLLAAAAHTADTLPFDDPGAVIHLVNRFTAAPIPVTGARAHAGFGAFRDLVEDYQPIRRTTSIYAPQAAPLRDLAFDAALLTVAAADPETGENRLGPDLPLADEETLLALDAGAAIAVIGYPYDTLDDGFAASAGTARVERGVIAAMTPPLDTIEEPRDPVTANLIIHRLATAGGNSGSPIIDAKGRVVGLHTHGIESVSSNADGAAQRADVLYDLLIEGRDETRLQDMFAPAWARMLSYWARAEDVLPWSFYMERARAGETPPPSVSDVIAAAAPPFSATVETLSFGPAMEERRVPATDIDAAAAGVEGRVETRDRAFVIREDGQYAEFWRTVDRRSDHVLFGFDYSLRSRTGFCRLTAYWRKKGETRLRVARNTASFELYLPAAGERTEDYHIVLRRDSRCDPISADFIAGSVSWSEERPGGPVQTAGFSEGGDNAAPGRATPVRAADRAALWANRFFKCTLRGDPAAPVCQPPEYIELETETI